jgi:MoxR-like ATPase
MNIKGEFRSFIISAVLPNKKGYLTWLNSGNIDERLSEIENEYEKAFNSGLFELDLNHLNRISHIELIQKNLKDKKNNSFGIYNENAGSGIPNAIINTHLCIFIRFYDNPIEFEDFQVIIDRVHEELGWKFCNSFQKKRIEFNGKSKVASTSTIFGNVRDNSWTINIGSEKELQYHMNFNEDRIVYGLGFNAQGSRNNTNPLGEVKPFINSYFKNKLEIKGVLLDYNFIDGSESKLDKINYNDFLCLGKIIPVNEGDENTYYISGELFLNLIYDLKYKQFEMYKLIYQTRNTLKDINLKQDMEIELIKKAMNVILTGSPGTGKTYLAKEFSKLITGSDSTESNSRFGFVQFHPSYDYTDFVEGLRPIKKDKESEIGFELKDGIFREFCNRAKNDSSKDYVFVIDEINRGEVSKIFGDLFFSIDPGYRGPVGKISTQYSNLREENDQFFYVPKNVFIIGTMNDIDRSVESFDFAMRRRFTWLEITAEESAMNMNLAKDAFDRMKSLNDAILAIEGLNSSYHIGAAYFLKLKDYNNDFDKLWNYHIAPLVKEYLRGMPNFKENFDKLENAYKLVS